MFLVPVERVDACHFLRCQLEVEHGDVLFLVIGIARTGVLPLADASFAPQAFADKAMQHSIVKKNSFRLVISYR